MGNKVELDKSGPRRELGGPLIEVVQKRGYTVFTKKYGPEVNVTWHFMVFYVISRPIICV